MELVLAVIGVVVVMATTVGVSISLAAKRGEQQRERESLHARLVAISTRRDDWHMDSWER